MKTRTSYLARIRNPNPKMPDAAIAIASLAQPRACKEHANTKADATRGQPRQGASVDEGGRNREADKRRWNESCALPQMDSVSNSSRRRSRRAKRPASTVTPPLARVPLVLNKRNFNWITESHLRRRRESSPTLVVGRFCHHLGDRGVRSVLHRLPDLDRRRRLGIESSGRLGVGHHQLRFLDRYRSRRHADLRDFVSAPPEVAHVDQPRGGSDDALRGDLRRDFPGHSRRPRLDGVVPRARCRTATAIWPNFRSPLLWDVFAVSTYFTVSVLFWYIGLVPDLATMRDRATSKIKKFLYGIFALGWRGSNRHWRHYEMAYLLLAGLSTPLVLSVHSVVSFDFATSVIPSWHTTIFPPYFVAGAIFGGFAMVLTLMLPARAIFKLQDIITPQHVDKMAKIILLTGSIVGYAYAMEFFIAWYSGNQYEKYAFYNRIFGPYWWYWWVGMMFCNVLSPQIFWFKWCRHNIFVVYFVCMCVNAGMWFERFIIIVGGLHRDFLPSSWGMFHADLGRYLDLHRHVRNLPLALPAFHALPAHDRDVGSQDRLAGSGSASRHAGRTSCRRGRRKGAHMRTPSGNQGLRNGGRVSERRSSLRSGETSARRGLQALGCALAVSDSRHG